MAIVNISLLLTSSSGLQDALQGVIAKGFTLTDYTDGTATPKISVGRTEEIAGALYRVETTDFTIDVTGVSGDGTYYIYVEDTGASITAKALSTVPTWRGDLGGYYLSAVSTSKAVFRFVKASTSYKSKSNISQTVNYIPTNITFDEVAVTAELTVDIINEQTTDSGVTVEGIKFEDSYINSKKVYSSFFGASNFELGTYNSAGLTRGSIFTTLNSAFSSVLDNEIVKCNGVVFRETGSGEFYRWDIMAIQRVSSTQFKIFTVYIESTVSPTYSIVAGNPVDLLITSGNTDTDLFYIRLFY